MRRVILLFTLFLASCATPSSPQDPVLPDSELRPIKASPKAAAPTVLTDLSVAQAVEVALHRNPDLGIAAARILAAQRDIEVVRSA